jgi:hypothetical protein
MSDKKQKIILTVGLQGSGKDFWAKKMIDDNPGVYKRVNKDLLREMLDNSHWSKKNEEFVKKVRDFIVELSLKDGHNVIVSDTNFDPSHKERMEQISWQLGKLMGYDYQTEDTIRDPIADIEIKDFTDVPLTECIRRDALRPNSVGKKVILDTYKRYLMKPFKQLEQNNKLPKAIICDLDGSLCLKGDRDIYDESKIYLDIINQPVLEILKGLDSKTTIIFCSGRTDSCYEQTKKWIDDNVLRSLNNQRYLLLMRKTDDKRGDEIVKKEIYDNEIKGKYFIKFIIDDRKKVKRMWVNEGLFVLDVNQFDEEY